MRNQRILLRQLVARYPRFASVSSRSFSAPVDAGRFPFSTLIKAGRFHSRKTRKTQSITESLAAEGFADFTI